MPDEHNTIFEYGKIPVVMRLNLGTSVPESYRFMGSKGLMDITGSQIEFTPQSGKDEEPSWYAASFPRPLRDAYYKEWHQEHDPAVGHEPVTEGVVYRGTQFDDVKPHLWTFFQAVKSRQPVTEDAVFGHHAALACHMANESYFRRSAVTWDEASRTIKS
jgi:hypothetical protein